MKFSPVFYTGDWGCVGSEVVGVRGGGTGREGEA